MVKMATIARSAKNFLVSGILKNPVPILIRSPLQVSPHSSSCTRPQLLKWSRAFSTGAEGVEHVKWDYRGQRTSVPLGPWVPDIAVDAFLAPNAVVVGRVVVQDSSSVWYGSVLRGDLNKVFVGFCSNVQEKCVLHAAQLSPTGLPAETFIDRFVTIGANSLLRSCHIEFESIIGQRCILMEGSLVEAHAILEAGSVLPPGRRIPSGELWGGNPAKFIRLLTLDEVAAIPKIAKAVSYVAQDHASEFLPYSTAYLEVEKLKTSLSIPL